MPADDPSLALHKHLALVLCESPAVLEELLLDVNLADYVHYQRVGARALVVPAQQLEPMRRLLFDRGIYPRIQGEILAEKKPSEEPQEDSDDAP